MEKPACFRELVRQAGAADVLRLPALRNETAVREWRIYFLVCESSLPFCPRNIIFMSHIFARGGIYLDAVRLCRENMSRKQIGQQNRTFSFPYQPGAGINFSDKGMSGMRNGFHRRPVITNNARAAGRQIQNGFLCFLTAAGQHGLAPEYMNFCIPRRTRNNAELGSQICDAGIRGIHSESDCFRRYGGIKPAVPQQKLVGRLEFKLSRAFNGNSGMVVKLQFSQACSEPQAVTAGKQSASFFQRPVLIRPLCIQTVRQSGCLDALLHRNQMGIHNHKNQSRRRQQ